MVRRLAVAAVTARLIHHNAATGQQTITVDGHLIALAADGTSHCHTHRSTGCVDRLTRSQVAAISRSQAEFFGPGFTAHHPTDPTETAAADEAVVRLFRTFEVI